MALAGHDNTRTDSCPHRITPGCHQSINFLPIACLFLLQTQSRNKTLPFTLPFCRPLRPAVETTVQVRANVRRALHTPPRQSPLDCITLPVETQSQGAQKRKIRKNHPTTNSFFHKFILQPIQALRAVNMQSKILPMQAKNAAPARKAPLL